MGCWRSIMPKWRSWSALTLTEKGTLIEALILLPLFRAGRRLSFERLKVAVRALKPWPSATDGLIGSRLEEARRTARLVSIASGLLPCRTSCLDRSLLLWALLRQRNIPSCLLIGVRKDRADFEAHAWVEIDGVALNDSADVRERFAAFSAPVAADGRLFF